MIMLEGFDDAFEGFVVQEKLQRPTVAVYNRKKCIKIMNPLIKINSIKLKIN